MADLAVLRRRLTIMVAAGSVPALTPAEVDELLVLFRRPDTEDRVYGDTGYEYTVDMAQAAAEGWRWKAAKVAGAYDFNSDGSGYSRSQIIAHCEQMAAHYAGRGGALGTMSLASDSTWRVTDVVGNLNDG